MSELKPCPFCGSKNVSVEHGKYMWWIQCEECAAISGAYTKKEEAIEAWNRRNNEQTD